MNEESDYEVVLKRLAIVCGIVVLAISAYFSYDGFDQNVGGGNANYTTLAKVIGVVMCVVMSLFQFILSSRYEQLNPTLKLVGFASYIYSVYTTYLGAQNVMGMSNEMSIAVALLFDIAPEPAIAWAFGDSLKGDLVGNLGKTALGMIGIGRKKGKGQPQPQQFPKQNTQPNPNGQGRGGGSERRAQLEMMQRAQGGGGHHGSDRRHEEGERPKEHQKHNNNRPNYRG